MANDKKGGIALQALNAENIGQMARLIETGNCILVLGPYCTGMAEKNRFLPLRAVLAKQLADELENTTGTTLPDPFDLPMVCSTFMAPRDASRMDLEFKVEHFYKQVADPGDVLRQVVKLPFKLILTVSPDNLLQRAFQQEGKLWDEGYYCFNETQKDNYSGSSRRPYIYQLFGKIRDNDSHGLVLTQEDQMKYIYSVVAEKTSLPASIRAVLQNSKGLLFLGFDFEYWYLRVLMHILEFAPSAEKVFGLQQGLEATLQPATHVFFKQQYKFTFLDAQPQPLLETLVETLKKQTPQSVARPALTLLYLYSEADEALRKALDRHLSALKEKYNITAQGIHDDLPGDTIEQARQAFVGQANLIVPVITSNYVATPWLSSGLARQALDRHGTGNVRVVAIYASKILGGTDPFAGRVAVLPDEDRCITDFKDPDEAYLKIAEDLEKIIQGML